MKKTAKKHFPNYSVAVVTHEATTGPAHDLRDFLIKHFDRLLFVAHPLLFIPANFKKSSYWEFWESARKTNEGKARHWIFPEFVLYLKDILYSIFWTTTKIEKTDIFFGINNINAFVGIFLKKVGLTKRVVFYCIDYIPKRFSSPFLNKIYHKVDKWAVEGSDVTWNLSPRMAQGRRERWGKVLGNQITVPIGVWYDRIQKHHVTKNHPHEIIYVGTIIEKQGLDMCIEAVRILKNRIKDIKLTIIGSGPYEDVLKDLVKKYKLAKYVEFLGYLPNHEAVERRLSLASLAVALYNPEKDMFTYFADPMKVKTYLACGLPVLITDIPYVVREMAKAECGIVVDYKLSDIVTKIEELLTDKTKTVRYRANALKFAKQYDCSTIYAKALDLSI